MTTSTCATEADVSARPRRGPAAQAPHLEDPVEVEREEDRHWGGPLRARRPRRGRPPVVPLQHRLAQRLPPPRRRVRPRPRRQQDQQDQQDQQPHPPRSRRPRPAPCWCCGPEAASPSPPGQHAGGAGGVWTVVCRHERERARRHPSPPASTPLHPSPVGRPQRRAPSSLPSASLGWRSRSSAKSLPPQAVKVAAPEIGGEADPGSQGQGQDRARSSPGTPHSSEFPHLPPRRAVIAHPVSQAPPQTDFLCKTSSGVGGAG